MLVTVVLSGVKANDRVCHDLIVQPGWEIMIGKEVLFEAAAGCLHAPVALLDGHTLPSLQIGCNGLDVPDHDPICRPPA